MSELLTPDALLEHWEGHRRLTLRVLEAFPEEELFGYSPAAPMRPFGGMVAEIINVEKVLVNALLTGEWRFENAQEFTSKGDLLEACAQVRGETRARWPELKPARLLEIGPVPLPKPLSPLEDFLYMIDNEIHHRAQGYVYLRLLGIEPPAFFER
ncbi:DinB family protein [soil metagenome]|jgi:uncharacterized damage-inducible protein DinB|nr:DinB family protein [Deinococcota bacterium]